MRRFLECTPVNTGYSNIPYGRILKSSSLCHITNNDTDSEMDLGPVLGVVDKTHTDPVFVTKS